MSKVDKTKTPKVLHPFLFPVFPVLAFYGANIHEVSWTELVLPVVVVLTVSSLLLSRLSSLLRNNEKSSCIVSLLWILFFSFGHIQLFVRNWKIGGLAVGTDRSVFLTLLAFFLVISFTLYRSEKWTMAVDRLLRRFSLILFTLSFLFCSVSVLYAHWGMNSAPNSALTNLSQLKPKTYSPDIYHIVLDGHGRSDVLKELYGYDNSSFLDKLKQKGFYIADQSRSNYVYTYSSMGATLNLTYLPPLSGSQRNNIFSNFQRKSETYGGLRESLLFFILRKLNYKIVSFYSEYGVTEIPRADIHVGSPNRISDFHYALLNMTPVRVLFYRMDHSDWWSPYRINRHRRTILSTLNYLPKLAAETRDYPIYAYVHLVSPHPPFVFGQDGGPPETMRPFTFWDDLGLQSIQGDLRKEFIQGYKAQAAFISKKTYEAVSKILEVSPRPPIIIIQGDHGPAAFVDWYNPNRMGLRERFSILNAYYFPGGGEKLLYNSISPVNTFRVLLNYYFGAIFPLLPDVNYFTFFTTSGFAVSSQELAHVDETHKF